MIVTQHAEARMSQRGFRPEDLDLIEQLGIAVHDGFLASDKASERLERSLVRMLDRVRRLRGKRVVALDGRAITAYRPGKKAKRRLLRNVAEGDLWL